MRLFVFAWLLIDGNLFTLLLPLKDLSWNLVGIGKYFSIGVSRLVVVVREYRGVQSKIK